MFKWKRKEPVVEPPSVMGEMLQGLLEAAVELTQGTPAPEVTDADGNRLYLFVRRFSVRSDAPSLRRRTGERDVPADYGFVHEAVASDPDTGEHAIVVTVLHDQEGESVEMMLVAAKTTPWTPEDAHNALKAFVLPDMKPNDCGIEANVLSRREDLTAEEWGKFEAAISLGGDSFLLIGHCKSRQAAGRKESQLRPVVEKYGLVLNAANVIDPDNIVPKHQGPEIAGGYYATAPTVASDLLQSQCIHPVDRVLPRTHALDDKMVLDWARMLATVRVSPDWPLAEHTHKLLSNALPYLKRFSSAPLSVKMGAELAKLRKDYAAANEKLAEVAAANLQAAEQLAAMGGELAQARTDLEQVQEKLRAERENFAGEKATFAQERTRLTMRVRELEKLTEPRPGELMFTRAEYEALQQEFLRMRDERDEAVGSLYREKAKAARTAQAPAPVERKAPQTWEELLPRVHEQLPHIWMEAGALKQVRGRLDRAKESVHWLAQVWTALCALEDYATHPKGGNFQTFIEKNPRQGLGLGHISLRESQTVRTHEKLREARIFSTPLGQLFFESHIVIGKTGCAPRLHFYDAVHDSGLVLVGYIGPHLPTAQTS